jgi:DNA invertase Pin-like site-specific DNA recombinase
VFAALAEFERGVICEHTQAGLNAARSRGSPSGRCYKLSQKGTALAVTMLVDSEHRIDDMCATVGISWATLYRYARAAKGATT